MGNRITNARNDTTMAHLDHSLKMSNGLTAVFIELLAISASQLAQTEREIDLAIWLAKHDQAIFGSGTVGFDISEIPWSRNDFENEQGFLLRVIDAARMKKGWELLDYQPNEAFVDAALHHFRALIEDFSIGFVSEGNLAEWQEIKPSPVTRCPRHQVYHHWQGCVVCNN